MRRVIFSHVLDDEGTLLEPGDFGQAPFCLLVEYLPPVDGSYGLKARIRLRGSEVADLIERHRLLDTPIYTDREAEAAADRAAALDSAFKTGFATEGPGYLFGGHWLGVVAERTAHWVKSQRLVRITFGGLLAGIEVFGTMSEMRKLAKELTMSVDKLAAEMETGVTFDGGGIRVVAPGTRRKGEDKPESSGTPPAGWGR